MSSYGGVLVTWIALGSAVLFVHLWLVYRCVTRGAALGGMRLLALVPPLTPWIGWRVGERALAVAWALMIIAYVVARFVGRGLLLSSGP